MHQSPGGESHHSLTSLSRMWTIKLFSMEKKFHRISINPSLTSSIWFAISQKLINFSEFFHQSFDWYETSHEIRDPRLLWRMAVVFDVGSLSHKHFNDATDFLGNWYRNGVQNYWSVMRPRNKVYIEKKNIFGDVRVIFCSIQTWDKLLSRYLKSFFY